MTIFRRTSADDWQLAITFELRKLGQLVMGVQLRSEHAACSAEALFVSGSAGDLLGSLGQLRSLTLLGVAQSLVGTAVPIQAPADRFVRVPVARPFSLQQLDGAQGSVTGTSLGVGGGHAWYTVSVRDLFTVKVSAWTASMILNFHSENDGVWRILGVRHAHHRVPDAVYVPPLTRAPGEGTA